MVMTSKLNFINENTSNVYLVSEFLVVVKFKRGKKS